MKKEYTQQEMEQILKGNAEIPLSVNRRIEDTYHKLGLTGNTRKRKSGLSGAADRGPGVGKTSAVHSASVTVHRKKRRAWTAVAAAAALTAGLSLTAFAVVNFMNVRLNDHNGILSYDFQIDPSVSEAHEISVTPTYLPEGYTDTDDDRKWQDADNPDNSITLISYNAAEIYLSEQTGEKLFRNFGEEEYVKTVEIQGIQTDLFLSGSDYTDSAETQKDLFLCSREQGYVVWLISIAEDQLSDDEMIKIAEGLDIRVLDETVPFPTEEEIAQAKAEFEFANSDDVYPDIKTSDIYATGDTIRDQDAFSDGTA